LINQAWAWWWWSWWWVDDAVLSAGNGAAARGLVAPQGEGGLELAHQDLGLGALLEGLELLDAGRRRPLGLQRLAC
jgi:hypothetical protein